MIQIIDKNGKSENIVMGKVVCMKRDSFSILISDDSNSINKMLESPVAEIAIGEYCEDVIKVKDHYVESSIKDGGSCSVLKSGQIIVYFERA